MTTETLTTLAAAIEAECIRRGWTEEETYGTLAKAKMAAAKGIRTGGWAAEAIYDFVQIKPTAYVADRERWKAMTFRLDSIATEVRQGEATAKIEGHYLVRDGKQIGRVMDLLRRTGADCSRPADSIHVA